MGVVMAIAVKKLKIPFQTKADAGGQFGSEGFVRRPPRFADQVADKSRTNTFISHSNSEPITEQQGLRGLDKYLRDVAAAAGHEHPEVAQTATLMRKNLTFIGEKEYAEAAKAIANYWRTHLEANPKNQIAVVTKISQSSLIKSDKYLFEKILESFSDTERAKYSGRIVSNVSALTADPANAKVVLLDDWTISGQQMSEAARRLLYHDATAKYAGQIEVNLLAASSKRVKTGLEVNFNSRQRSIPVKTYYQAWELKTEGLANGARITGTHSSVDFGFNSTLNDFKRALGEKISGLWPNIPSIGEVVRPYREHPLPLVKSTEATTGGILENLGMKVAGSDVSEVGVTYPSGGGVSNETAYQKWSKKLFNKPFKSAYGDAGMNFAKKPVIPKWFQLPTSPKMALAGAGDVPITLKGGSAYQTSDHIKPSSANKSILNSGKLVYPFDRWRMAEDALGKSGLLPKDASGKPIPLSAKQAIAVEQAHTVGFGEPGAKPGTTAGIGNYTTEQNMKKGLILRRAGFTPAQTRLLMERGITGISTITTGSLPSTNGAGDLAAAQKRVAELGAAQRRFNQVEKELRKQTEYFSRNPVGENMSDSEYRRLSKYHSLIAERDKLIEQGAKSKATSSPALSEKSGADGLKDELAAEKAESAKLKAERARERARLEALKDAGENPRTRITVSGTATGSSTTSTTGARRQIPPAAEAEVGKTDRALRQKIAASMRKNGIAVTAERLDELTAIAKKNAGRGVYTDHKNGIRVAASEGKGQIDFMPDVKKGGQVLQKVKQATPEGASEIGVKGIRGIQNYVILSDAGLVEPVEVLQGETNPSMKKVAIKKMGFENLEGHYKNNVTATLESVRENAFSEKNLRLQGVLEQRVSTQQLSETKAKVTQIQNDLAKAIVDRKKLLNDPDFHAGKGYWSSFSEKQRQNILAETENHIEERTKALEKARGKLAELNGSGASDVEMSRAAPNETRASTNGRRSKPALTPLQREIDAKLKADFERINQSGRVGSSTAGAGATGIGGAGEAGREPASGSPTKPKRPSIKTIEQYEAKWKEQTSKHPLVRNWEAEGQLRQEMKTAGIPIERNGEPNFAAAKETSKGGLVYKGGRVLKVGGRVAGLGGVGFIGGLTVKDLVEGKYGSAAAGAGTLTAVGALTKLVGGGPATIATALAFGAVGGDSAQNKIAKLPNMEIVTYPGRGHKGESLTITHESELTKNDLKALLGSGYSVKAKTDEGTFYVSKDGKTRVLAKPGKAENHFVAADTEKGLLLYQSEDGGYKLYDKNNGKTTNVSAAIGGEMAQEFKDATKTASIVAGLPAYRKLPGDTVIGSAPIKSEDGKTINAKIIKKANGDTVVVGANNKIYNIQYGAAPSSSTGGPSPSFKVKENFSFKSQSDNKAKKASIIQITSGKNKDSYAVIQQGGDGSKPYVSGSKEEVEAWLKNRSTAGGPSPEKKVTPSLQPTNKNKPTVTTSLSTRPGRGDTVTITMPVKTKTTVLNLGLVGSAKITTIQPPNRANGHWVSKGNGEWWRMSDKPFKGEYQRFETWHEPVAAGPPAPGKTQVPVTSASVQVTFVNGKWVGPGGSTLSAADQAEAQAAWNKQHPATGQKPGSGTPGTSTPPNPKPRVTPRPKPTTTKKGDERGEDATTVVTSTPTISSPSPQPRVQPKTSEKPVVIIDGVDSHTNIGPRQGTPGAYVPAGGKDEIAKVTYNPNTGVTNTYLKNGAIFTQKLGENAYRSKAPDIVALNRVDTQTPSYLQQFGTPDQQDRRTGKVPLGEGIGIEKSLNEVKTAGYQGETNPDKTYSFTDVKGRDSTLTFRDNGVVIQQSQDGNPYVIWDPAKNNGQHWPGFTNLSIKDPNAGQTVTGNQPKYSYPPVDYVTDQRDPAEILDNEAQASSTNTSTVTSATNDQLDPAIQAAMNAQEELPVWHANPSWGAPSKNAIALAGLDASKVLEERPGKDGKTIFRMNDGTYQAYDPRTLRASGAGTWNKDQWDEYSAAHPVPPAAPEVTNPAALYSGNPNDDPMAEPAVPKDVISPVSTLDPAIQAAMNRQQAENTTPAWHQNPGWTATPDQDAPVIARLNLPSGVTVLETRPGNEGRAIYRLDNGAYVAMDPTDPSATPQYAGFWNKDEWEPSQHGTVLPPAAPAPSEPQVIPPAPTPAAPSAPTVQPDKLAEVLFNPGYSPPPSTPANSTIASFGITDPTLNASPKNPLTTPPPVSPPDTFSGLSPPQSQSPGIFKRGRWFEM